MLVIESNACVPTHQSLSFKQLWTGSEKIVPFIIMISFTETGVLAQALDRVQHEQPFQDSKDNERPNV